ncbi:hypothetical protein BH23ACT10_BH23ACT10_29540 [soil metagenome]
MAVTSPEALVAVAAGAGAWASAQELRGVPGVRVAATPRHATVLLIAGEIVDDDGEALRRVHDQLPRPRAVVAWRPVGAAADVPARVVDDGDLDAVVTALRGAQAEVLADPARGADDLLPDTEPNAWRGVGPFGQGGEGMMGGTPYGRPMTMTGEDRDGLALDRLDLTLGPFLDALPGGHTLRVTLQGEVLQAAELTVRDDSDRRAHPTDPGLRAARRLLCRTAHGMHVAGLDALASRAATLACRVTDDADRTALVRAAGRLRRRVRHSGLLWTLRDVGTIGGADAADRWRTRLAALTAGLDGRTDDVAQAPARAAVEDALVGMTMTDAVTTLASIDAPQSQLAMVTS